MAVAAPRAEIECQKVYDRARSSPQVVLVARMRAVVAAQGALARDEEGAAEGLRGALVDLAAIAETLADELPHRHAP